MIETLAKPSICVIDEDVNEYGPILKALNEMYLSAIHIKGDSTAGLPSQPFTELRLVFTDLYLASGPTGKAMANHTANIFCKIVSPDTAPVIVVIWSKHSDEKFDDGSPPDDQPTESDLFINTLLEVEPKYKGRLIFIKMVKTPSENWVEELKAHISNLLVGHESIEALWIWESLVKGSALKVSKELTDFSITTDAPETLKRLKVILQLLTNAQKEGKTLTKEVAPHYLATVLGQLLVDQIEHADGIRDFEKHGEWLIQSIQDMATLVPSINSMLLTAELPKSEVPFLPGSIYLVQDESELSKHLATDLEKIKASCQTTVLTETSKEKAKEAFNSWMKTAQFVMFEITPGCDVDNGDRAITTLILGVVMPESFYNSAQNKDSFKRTPIFSLRKGLAAEENKNVFLVFSTRNKITLPATQVPLWLQPWFRFRELPTADVRNWHSSQASRIGYVSL
jgi:hypothetical protein